MYFDPINQNIAINVNPTIAGGEKSSYWSVRNKWDFCADGECCNADICCDNWGSGNCINSAVTTTVTTAAALIAAALMLA